MEAWEQWEVCLEVSKCLVLQELELQHLKKVPHQELELVVLSQQMQPQETGLALVLELKQTLLQECLEECHQWIQR